MSLVSTSLREAWAKGKVQTGFTADACDPMPWVRRCEGTAAKSRLSKSVSLLCRVCGRHSLYPGSLPSYFPVASLSHRDDCLLKYSVVNKQQTKVSYENSSALPKGTSRCFRGCSSCSSSRAACGGAARCHGVRDAACPRPGT